MGHTRWGLELVSHSSYVDGNGLRHVAGEVRNTAAVPLSNPRAIVSLVGNESWGNALIAAMEKNVMSGSLAPGSSASFDAAVARLPDEAYSHYGIVLEHN